ncbi:coiled-coil domain-containing protein 125-like [Apostichopus japonicus]|uniref:coiled-coil domain-containing protein 125-like n=1 Tax=Stichopus japonicus TaxID=307972 RepID=UPI003AB531DF
MSLKSHHGESSHSRGSQDQAVFKSGDLGMGRGLKPGAISFDTDEEQKSSFTEFFSPSRKCSVSSCHYCSFQEGTEDSSLRLSDGPDDSVRSFPSYAGVPFGTSLRQHRRLYEASRRAFPGNTSHDAGQIVGDMKHSCGHLTVERAKLTDQLKVATEEVDTLQNELEVCQSHLESKLRAIKILQHQASVVNSRCLKNEEKIQAMKSGLEKEVNTLQFALDVKSTSLMKREETWSEKFNRVSLENSVLMSTLQARTEEVRRLHADKVALIRERDELLARMDAKERLRYEQHWTTKNDQAYLQHTLSEQLAVLGACMCRGNNPEPCKCARIAAILTKETGCLKDEMARLKQKLVESVLVSDAFRKAFEEQLQCNSMMLRNVTDSQKIIKEEERKAQSHFWKKKKCNNVPTHHHHHPVQVQYGLSNLPVTRSFEEQEHNNQKQRTVGLQVCQPIPDSSTVYEDLLSDKSEALAHQRLVSKLLAQKTQDLEQAVKKVESFMSH